MTAIEGDGPTVSSMWLFQCDCGQEKRIRARAVIYGNTKSCGCLNIERIKERSTTHGLTDHPLYQLWAGMHARCSNPSHIGWKSYGGRGITVCERWNSFEAFLEDMGERPAGKTLDREDTNGNYEPGNCKWSTRQEQQLNTSRNVRVTVMGCTMTISEWSERLGVDPRTINQRRYRGMSDFEAVAISFGDHP